MSGPPPIPTKLKQLRGNPGKQALNKREPQPQAVTPTRPGWLLVEAKREWSRIVPELRAMGLLTRVDRAALCNYCQWWARWREAEETLTRDGIIFTTTNGYPVPSPAAAISQKAAQIMKSFLTEFGLTPASRSRVHLPEPKRDEVSDFLERVSAEYDDLEPPSGDKSA